MNKVFKIKLLFIILPFLDVITALLTRNTGIRLTPGILFKSVLLLYFIIYIVRSKSKYNKLSFGFLFFIFLYFIFYFIFKSEIFDKTFILNELIFLFKLIYFPICFVGLLCYFDDNGVSISYITDVFKFTLILYVLLLIIPTIFGISYTTYPKYLKGYVGLFYAGNEIANIMVILFPFSYLFINKSKYSFLIVFPIILVMIMIGTKVVTFGCLIITTLSLIFSIIKNKFRINSVVLKCLSIFIFALILSLNSYAVYNFKFMKNNYYPDESKEIIIDNNIKAEVEEIQGNLNIFYDKNKLTKIIRPLVNGRDILLANTISVYNDLDNDSNIWLGIGFSNTNSVNNTNVARLIEIDICDLYFHFGIIGLLISLFPFIIVGYLFIVNFSKIKLNSIYLLFILFLVICVSTFSGHVLFAPAVSIYLVLLLLLFLCEFDCYGRKINKNKKISILALHLGYGGVEKSIIDQANMLSEFYDVEVVSLYKLYDYIPYKVNDKVKIKYLSNLKPNRNEFKDAANRKNIKDIINEGFKAIKILYLKRKLISDYIYNCDSNVVISSRIDFTKLLNRYGNNLAVKVAEEHVYHNNSKKYFKLLKKSMKNINYLIPASKYLYDDYEKLFKNENVIVKYIPQIVGDISLNKSKCNNYNIVSVGRLSKEKGYDDLIKVFDLVHKKNKKIKLIIVGDGDEKENLENLVSQYKLNKYIKFTGFLTQDKLKDVYINSSLYVMTSLEESFGLVLLEAMSYGIPCIAFDSALGAKEIIDDKSGILIKNRNLEEMADTICNYFVGKYKFNISDKIQNYSYDKVKIVWRNFVDDCLNKNDKKKCLFVSSQGGHLNELLKLEDTINNYNSLVVTERCNNNLKYKTKYLMATTRYQFSYVYGIFYNCFKSLNIFLSFIPDVIISTGSHTAIPLCLIGHLFGKKIVYIESFANISTKSLAGSIAYNFADVFIVQWEDMLKLYPNAIYIGGLY